MPLLGRETGAKQPLLGGAVSSCIVTYKPRLHMSRTLPWITILFFVAPCHRAGDLEAESSQIVSPPVNPSGDNQADKYSTTAGKSFVAEWSFEKPLWRNVNGTVPQMREEAATWTDPDSGDWWLFGGHRKITNKSLLATKEKALKKNRFDKNMGKHDTNGGTALPTTTKYYSDLWHYQPSERIWTRVYPSPSSSIPTPGGPDHPLTRPILCSGGGKQSTYAGVLVSDHGDSSSDSSKDTLSESSSRIGRVDGRVMAVYAPGSKPVDTVWLLEMNDTRLWTTYVCCDEDASTTESSPKPYEENKTKAFETNATKTVPGVESANSDHENSENPDMNIPVTSSILEEGPQTFCPDFHTLTRPPITWCDKESQALFALDITSFEIAPKDLDESINVTSMQNNNNETKSSDKSKDFTPKLWRFDLGLTQWEHIYIKKLRNFSNTWKCGRETSNMHWTSLGKCLIVLCPDPDGPSNLLNSLSMCVENGSPILESLGTIQLSQGASHAHRWTLSAVESSITGRKYLLLAYGRLLDIWVLEQGSYKWSSLENIWQGAALKWFRANMGLYHLQIVEDAITMERKVTEEEEEEVEELEEGKALGIAHVGELGIPLTKKHNESNESSRSNKNKIFVSSNSKGIMEVYMINPRDGSDVSLREKGLFIIRISEDNGTIFGNKADIQKKASLQKEAVNHEDESTTYSGQPNDEILNVSSQADLKNGDEILKNESTKTSEIFYPVTGASTLKAEEETEMYDQNQGEGDEEDDEWSAELVLETNGSSPVLNASLLALVEGDENNESNDGLARESNSDSVLVDSDNVNHISTVEVTNLNHISIEKEPLIEASAIVNLEQNQEDKLGVIRPLSIEENDIGRGSITLGAFGSEEESGYQGTILFFAVSFSMFMLFIVIVFLRRFVVINCQFASHHLAHRCRSNSSVLLKEPPPIRYSVIPDEVCYAGMNTTAMPVPGSPIPPPPIHNTLSRPLTT